MSFNLKTISGVVAMGAILLVALGVIPAKTGLIVGAIGAAGAVFLPADQAAS